MKSKRYWFGVIVSIGWLAFCGWLIYIRWCDVKAMPLNEYGDFMAGAFAPLAFLWLVLGYLQQGEELKLSTDALKLQAIELKNSVEQQAALVEVSRQQVDAERLSFQYEQVRRERDSEPNFTVTLVSHSAYISSAEYSLTLTNSGAAVRHVKVEFRHAQDSAVLIREFPIFAEFSQQPVKIIWTSALVSDSELIISYETLMAKRGTKKIHIRMGANRSESVMTFTAID